MVWKVFQSHQHAMPSAHIFHNKSKFSLRKVGQSIAMLQAQRAYALGNVLQGAI